ncbi:MAG TPA: gas vesicle protein [Thermoanaerobaculia bacterium]|nr:gas vesicle protein [Thermoanaerobaculia bacterium]
MAYEDRPLQRQPQGLVDILDKILDKGLVVAGDVKVSLANVELLTIQLRLVVCSIDKAESIGINWWKGERFYSADAPREVASPNDVAQLNARIAELERRLAPAGPRQSARTRAKKESDER